ncbi:MULTISPECIES: hypothetical protein [unclassified Saccharicrinis]
MGVEDIVGSIAKGKKANLILTKTINSYATFAYSYSPSI